MNGRVETDVDAEKVTGDIVSDRITSTGLLKVKLNNGSVVVRHRNRVRPISAAAAAFLASAKEQK